MKKRPSSIRISKPAGKGGPVGLAALPAGVIFLGGLWAAVWQWLSPGSGWGWALAAAAAAAGLCVGLLLRWDRPVWGIALAALLAALLAAGLLCRARLTASAAAIGNLAAHRLLLQTGRYHLPYSGGGSVWPLLLPLAALSGGAAAWLLRRRLGWCCMLAGLAALGLRLWGLADGGWPLAVLLLGSLLCLLPQQGLRRQTVLTGMSLFFAGLTALVPLIPGLVPEQGDGTLMHRLRYESHASALPEGDLTRGRGSGSQAALSVTMEHWGPLYLRGYAAGVYTGTGWQRLDGEALAADAGTLYTLQRSCFFPATQLSAAWESLAGGESRQVTVTNLGACRERLYLPYGAQTDLPDAADLAGEGACTAAGTVTMAVYPAEDSYLLQEQLAENDTGTPYSQGEAVYRQWVYDHYLTVPQSTYDALTRDFTPQAGMTTTQAKNAVLRYLSQAVSYREGASVSGSDIAAAIVVGGQQGSDIHYATLAALLLRCCGIPARYVEGYAVTAQQAEAMPDGASLTLTERSSHAWAEYYLDGVGWLPFDAAPGYTDLVQYRLPENGPEGDDGHGDITQPETPPRQQEPDVTPEDHDPQDRHRVYIRNVLLTLAILLGLALAALAVHTVLGRRRLRRQALRYQDPDCRMGCGYILCTVHELLAQTGAGRTREEQRELLIPLLQGGFVKELLALDREVWYSGHTMTEDQRQRCLALLEESRRVWREKTPALRRFVRRYITCKVF